MFIVITRSTFNPEIEREVLALAQQSGPIARAQSGPQFHDHAYQS